MRGPHAGPQAAQLLPKLAVQVPHQPIKEGSMLRKGTMLAVETHRRHLPDNVPAGVCPVQSGLLEHLPVPGGGGGVSWMQAASEGSVASHIYYAIIEKKEGKYEKHCVVYYVS